MASLASMRAAICSSMLHRISRTRQNGDGDNVYEVEVAATDAAGNTAYQTITVTVTDVDEIAPVFTSGAVPRSSRTPPRC